MNGTNLCWAARTALALLLCAGVPAGSSANTGAQ
jgi:hypothetical protein